MGLIGLTYTALPRRGRRAAPIRYSETGHYVRSLVARVENLRLEGLENERTRTD